MEGQSVDEHKKKESTRRVVLIIVAVFFILAVVMWMNKDKVMNYDHTLMISAMAVNATCPQVINETIRLDSVAAKIGRKYFYYYTILNIEKDSVDVEQFCNMLEDNFATNLKKEAAADIEEFAKNGVTLNFAFKDQTGDNLCSITLRPEQYLRDATTD